MTGETPSAARRSCGRFDFFGVTVDVHAIPADLDDARFFYGGHETHADPATAAEVTVTLECVDWPERGFFTSLLSKDGLRKGIRVATAADRSADVPVDHEFTGWSDLPSPLPPFHHSRLWTEVATHPGAAMVLADGRGVLLLGENHVGKTAVTLELCRGDGRLVSDSVIVLHPGDGRVLGYASPLGLRRQTLRANLALLNTLDRRETISPVTGLVVLVRPQDYFGVPNLAHAGVDQVLYLRRAEGTPALTTVPTPALPWYSGVASSTLQAALPPVTTVVSVLETTPPAEVAGLITERTSP